MNTEYQMQRLSVRTAMVLSVPSWVGFIYTLRHRPIEVDLPHPAFLPEIGFVTVATLLCSLITLLCSLSKLGDDFSSPLNWLFVTACGFPFFGMLALLDPFGFVPTAG